MKEHSNDVEFVPPLSDHEVEEHNMANADAILQRIVSSTDEELEVLIATSFNLDIAFVAALELNKRRQDAGEN